MSQQLKRVESSLCSRTYCSISSPFDAASMTSLARTGHARLNPKSISNHHPIFGLIEAVFLGHLMQGYFLTLAFVGKSIDHSFPTATIISLRFFSSLSSMSPKIAHCG